MFKGSWKTTTAGILGIVAAAITLIAVPLLNGQSAHFAEFSAILMPAVGLLFSRDDDKSSEDVGAK